MTDEKIRDMARTVAREVVHEMMLTMGVDASKPEGLIEMQKELDDEEVEVHGRADHWDLAGTGGRRFGG